MKKILLFPLFLLLALVSCKNRTNEKTGEPVINEEVTVPKTYAEISVKEGGRWQGKKYVGDDFRFKNVAYLKAPDSHTDHSYYVRYEGPGWESNKVGYRLYLDWRNAIDIFEKR